MACLSASADIVVRCVNKTEKETDKRRVTADVEAVAVDEPAVVTLSLLTFHVVGYTVSTISNQLCRGQ